MEGSLGKPRGFLEVAERPLKASPTVRSRILSRNETKVELFLSLLETRPNLIIKTAVYHLKPANHALGSNNVDHIQ